MPCLFAEVKNSCGCIIGYQLPLLDVDANRITDYPVYVVNIDGTEGELATSPSEYAKIWNSYEDNQQCGKLYVYNSTFCFYLDTTQFRNIESVFGRLIKAMPYYSGGNGIGSYHLQDMLDEVVYQVYVQPSRNTDIWPTNGDNTLTLDYQIDFKNDGVDNIVKDNISASSSAGHNFINNTIPPSNFPYRLKFVFKVGLSGGITGAQIYRVNGDGEQVLTVISFYNRGDYNPTIVENELKIDDIVLSNENNQCIIKGSVLITEAEIDPENTSERWRRRIYFQNLPR